MGWMFWATAAQAEQVSEGAVAPPFALKDQHGRLQRLADYQGRWLVLYFYPKDDTPGCTTEACAFRDGYLELKALGVEVLGVSLDDSDSHAAFAGKYHLPFPLLADARGEVARAYGVLWKLGPLQFAKRQTFIVDPQGRIAKHYPSVKAKGHAREVVQALGALQAGSD